MGKRKRECLTCGTKYEYCGTCNKKDPAWMAEFHQYNCKSIFDICTRYNMQLMSKSEAKFALSACDLSNKDGFKDFIKRDLANIFAEEPKVKRAKRVEVKPVDEAIVEVEPQAIEEIIHEVVNKTEE